jgi:Domain of unknown function (DUF4382)
MRLGGKVAFYAAMALVVAAAIIVGSSPLGVAPTGSVFTPTAPGVLSVLLTDPPSVPAGVTAVYVTFSALEIHVTQLPNDSGWIPLAAQGTINTLGLVNLSQTISSDNAPSGRYNLVSFKIDSVAVTYQGSNYSASVRHDSLTVPIIGGLEVNSSKPAAALIDVFPTVVNFGSDANPVFVVSTAAHALQVPSTDVQPGMHHLGSQTPLQSKGWFTKFSSAHSYNLTVTSATMTQNSLSVTVTSGPDSLELYLIVVTPSVTHGHSNNPTLALSDSVAYFLSQNGTMRQLQVPGVAGNQGLVDSVLASLSPGGYLLRGSSSATFTFTGHIAFPTPKNSSTSGYTITVIGDQVAASLPVTVG